MMINGNHFIAASEASPLLFDSVPITNNTATEIDTEEPPSENGNIKINGEQGDDAAPIVLDIEESFSSWVRLLLFFCATVVSGGIIPGQNVYNRLFCEAGLFAYACSRSDVDDGDSDSVAAMAEEDDVCCPAQWLIQANVMNVISCFMTFFFMASGLVFDMIGGRYAAVLGCLVNAAGFVVLAALVRLLSNGSSSDHDGAATSNYYHSPVVETAIFVSGVLLVDIGSLMTNISFYSFLWHLPKQQALILSLSNCVFQVAAFVPLVIRALIYYSPSSQTMSIGVNNYLLSSLSSVLFLYAVVITLIATPICWLTVPSTKEYLNRAMEVLKLPIPARRVKGMKGSMDMVKKAWRILKHHTRLHCLTMIVGSLAWMAPFIYMTMTDPMAQEIFGDTACGERLATMYNVYNGYLGLFIGPILGVIVDRSHRPKEAVEMMGYCIVTTLIIISVLCPIPSWNVQLVNISSSAICQISTSLYLMRYAIIFAPPDRVGTVSGLFLSGIGMLSFIPIIGISLDIAINESYIQPQQWLCISGAVAWVFYIAYVKKSNPWPSSPVMLPEDELKLAKMYGVGTIEEAAYVSRKSVPEFRRLSSSSNVLHQRALLDAAFTGGAAERVMNVARRRSGIDSMQSMDEVISTLRGRSGIGSVRSTADNILQYPIVEDSISNFTSVTIRQGTAATSLDCILIAFNGHGGFGGRGEPTIRWVMEPLGGPDDPKRIAVFRSLFSPTITCAELFGTILETRVMDDDGNEVTAAACTAFHPTSLESGTIMQTGSDRYYCSIAAANEVPAYMDREICGEKMMQRFVGMKQDSAWDDRRKEYISKKPIWYIGALGTHPGYQGKGLARRLLNVVAKWAQKDGADCYLECSEANVPFYEKCGYKNIWRSNTVVDGTSIGLFGMALRMQP